jgi:cell division protein FtsB
MAAAQRRLTVRLRIGLLAVVIAGLAVTGIAPAQQVYEQDRLIESERARLAELTRQNTDLERRLARNQDPAYVEKLAREQLGLVRPGETAYVVVPGSAIPAPPEPRPEPPSLWDRVSRWFGELLSYFDLKN